MAISFQLFSFPDYSFRSELGWISRTNPKHLFYLISVFIQQYLWTTSLIFCQLDADLKYNLFCIYIRYIMSKLGCKFKTIFKSISVDDFLLQSNHIRERCKVRLTQEYPGLTVSGEKRKTVAIKKSNRSRYIEQIVNN